ncbi:MAG TPA: FAD-dependent oxidoreductase, partial [Verrucomicrobiae bacterium]
MRRRTFLGSMVGATGILPVLTASRAAEERRVNRAGRRELSADLVVVGGGLGGVAAALAAARNGLRVILTEETDWIGGQLTSQAVPPDEHQWIETHGSTASYRALRNGIRDFYRRNYPLRESARKSAALNPGDGSVSRLCHEPRVALAVLEEMLAPYVSQGKLRLLLETQAVAAEVGNDSVRSVKVRDLRSGNERLLSAPFFIDATELGDLLPLTKMEFVMGAEGRGETGELHAPEKRDATNQQAFTMCFAVDYDPNGEHVIEKPKEYGFWRDFVPKLRPPWPGRLLSLTYTHPATLQAKTLGFNPDGETAGTLNLWKYRRLISRRNFEAGAYAGDVSLVNWPQNDYLLGNLVGVSEREKARNIERATQLSLSLLYWLQTEAPRLDGKHGWPGLRLRGDLLGSEAGVAKYPYVREARRIRAEFTVLEQHVGIEARAKLLGIAEAETKAEVFGDSVGIGSYPIDLHPTSAGDNYIDFQTRPFQIPLGALIPARVENLLGASKNIGTTHVTNGCYRLHPVEWNIGEAAGLVA